jgi:ligand-binding sensor domain-containing protein
MPKIQSTTQNNKVISMIIKSIKMLTTIKLPSQMHLLTFLSFLLFSTACNAPVKKELPKVIEHPKLIKNVGNGNMQCSLQDKAGKLWFGTSDNGLYKYDGKSFARYTVNDGLNSNHISCLLEAKDGKIWIGTEAGLCLYDGKTFAEIKIPLPKDLTPNKNEFYKNSHWVYTMIQAKNEVLWFVTIDGVYNYDGISFKPFYINEAKNSFLGSNDKVERILEDKAGNIWFGSRTNEGVFRYDGKSITNFKLENLTLQFETKQVSHNWAWPQLQDSDGNIWFSNWAGAYRYDGHTFQSFSKSDGLGGYNGLVAKIIEDKNGKLWFGGDGGLTSYDGKSFTNYNKGLSNPWIWTLLEDISGNIWVGTREQGLYLFDGKTFINYTAYKQ